MQNALFVVKSDFRTWKEPFSEVYVVSFSLV